MFRRIYFFLFFFSALNIYTFAQELPKLFGDAKPVMVNPLEVVLYDQMSSPGTNSLNSQNFETANDAFDNQGADDFIVPAGETWNIESIDVLGIYFNGAGPATSVNVWFYNDQAGLPGSTEAEVLSIVPSAGVATGSFTITFTSPVAITEGHYWLSIQCNMDFAVGGQWGWTEHPQFNLESAWTNPGGGFGTACTASWGYRVTNCAVGTVPNTDLAFRLNGTTSVVPVELTSFTANSNNGTVVLNWSTATETNNSGFQIERKTGNEFEVLGFIAGNGTSTEIHNYSYFDKNVNAGKYSYRLKQIDFNGEFEYSKAVEVEVVVKDFSLLQNFPNPFNPSTKINFSLAVDSKVKLNIYNLLGEQVAQLLNSNLTAGNHDVVFDATNLNSGVYFYKLEANGIDGQAFTSTKKMILTK